jgi:hypothetical protein
VVGRHIEKNAYKSGISTARTLEVDHHDRNLRRLDFDRRCREHPGGVYVHSNGGGVYLPIHPFADEPELLAKLTVKVDDCRSVEAYWRIGDDVCFLQVWLSTDDPLGRSGLFARWSDGEPPMLNVVAVLQAQSVTRCAFEAAMSEFLRIGIPTNDRFASKLGDHLRAIGE